ncbi:hypothetical protein ACH4VX_33785 [Streptomyces sp. NPDC020731]|uniref:hypothetical protein n=1 Tax=Streptomyces sp. NPDC020731 TaxID=3365085 RepID=UPI003795ADBE
MDDDGLRYVADGAGHEDRSGIAGLAPSGPAWSASLGRVRVPLVSTAARGERGLSARAHR